MQTQAIIFDKDGTLFDFRATWDIWAADLIEELAAGDPGLQARLMAELRFDPVTRGFHPDSPVIAGTNREAAECVARAMPGPSVEALELFLMERAMTAPLAPAVPLAPLLARLRAAGLRLAVMTNDSEASALAHLEAVGVRGLFDAVAGFDSGHGAKPDPDPLLALAGIMEVPPARTFMVGDSTHDLIAGRAAGMGTVAVLTGPAEAQELTPHADGVLPDIGHLPAWLGMAV